MATRYISSYGTHGRNKQCDWSRHSPLEVMGEYAALPRRDATGPWQITRAPNCAAVFKNRPSRRRARQYEPIITTALPAPSENLPAPVKAACGKCNLAVVLRSCRVVSDDRQRHSSYFSVRQLRRPAAGKGGGPVSWVLSPFVVLAPSEPRPSVVPRIVHRTLPPSCACRELCLKCRSKARSGP
jgi:hypothetical protein